MRVAAIIAEYNPFHNGHAFQIRYLKESMHVDYVIIVMSPDFVQRGEPALIDQHLRAQMALHAGADLVLSMPVCFSTGASASFAEGAVRILDMLGCVDLLCFGCEHPGSIGLMQEAASVLASEPALFQQTLRSSLSAGASFARARADALWRCLSLSEVTHETDIVPEKGTAGENLSGKDFAADEPVGKDPAANEAAGTIFSLPNNILAVDYLRALIITGSSIRPCPILRRDAGYHSLTLPSEDALPENLPFEGEQVKSLFSSAASIRRALFEGNCAAASAFMPDAAFSLLPEDIPDLLRAREERYSLLLRYCLLEKDDLSRYLDVSEDLENRIRRLLPGYEDAASFTMKLKTRQIAHSRVRRALLHIFLGIRKDQVPAAIFDAGGLYARILGFRRQAQPLLHRIKKEGHLPLVTKPADAPSVLPSQALQLFQQDLHACDLYRLLDKQPAGSEYTRSPFVLH